MRPMSTTARPPFEILRAVLIGMAALLVLPGVVHATRPTVETQSFDITFPSAFWTAACELPVHIRAQGTVTFRFFHDRAGAIVSELDLMAGYKETVSSPLDVGGTGQSFTYARAEPVRIVYPEGPTLDAPAVIYDNGLGGFYAPGLPVAGRAVLEGKVVLIAPGNIPIVEVTSLISSHGRSIDLATAVAARCEFLTSP